MAHLIVRTPDLLEPVTVDVVPESAWLLGREPEPGKLAGEEGPPLPPYPLRQVRIPSNQVSANHVLLVCTQQGTWVHDLHSRNGSWLRLAPGQPALLPPRASFSLELAGAAAGNPRLQGPQEAAWDQPGDFGASVLRSLDAWLRRLGVMAQPRLSGDSDCSAEARRFPLADGSQLCIELTPRETQRSQWPSVIEQLQAYLAEQNARYEQEQGHEEGFILNSFQFQNQRAVSPNGQSGAAVKKSDYRALQTKKVAEAA